ncbi:DNA mismatch repair protein MutT [Bacillus thuringiensis serovar muju]|nr:DNA mismatch repair protein MutT [Bacillus thuringiensis serovar muju]
MIESYLLVVLETFSYPFYIGIIIVIGIIIQ